jgi:hypothetical protein
LQSEVIDSLTAEGHDVPAAAKAQAEVIQVAVIAL